MARPHRLNGGQKRPVTEALGEAVLEMTIQANSLVELGHAALRLAASHDPAAGDRAYRDEYVSRLEARRRGLVRLIGQFESGHRQATAQLAIVESRIKQNGSDAPRTRAA